MADTLSLKKSAAPAPAAKKAAPAPAPTHARYENEQEAKARAEVEAKLGTMSDKVKLVKFLYFGPSERTSRQTPEGKVWLNKPKNFVGAILKFDADYQVPVIPLTDAHVDRNYPYFQPHKSDISGMRPVKAGQTVVLNQMELAVFMLQNEISGRFVTEKTFKGYEKAARPGPRGQQQDRGKLTTVHEEVIAQYKETKAKDGNNILRLILAFGNHAPEASVFYRNVENCQNVLDPSGVNVASDDPQFAQFSVYCSQHLTSGARVKGRPTVKSKKNAKAFLHAMNMA